MKRMLVLLMIIGYAGNVYSQQCIDFFKRPPAKKSKITSIISDWLISDNIRVPDLTANKKSSRKNYIYEVRVTPKENFLILSSAGYFNLVNAKTGKLIMTSLIPKEIQHEFNKMLNKSADRAGVPHYLNAENLTMLNNYNITKDSKYFVGFGENSEIGNGEPTFLSLKGLS